MVLCKTISGCARISEKDDEEISSGSSGYRRAEPETQIFYLQQYLAGMRLVSSSGRVSTA
jgi:hypothetical protein